MIYWALLLHFYQPPTQLPPVLNKIVKESYEPLINILLEYPETKATVNINGALTDWLVDINRLDIIEKLADLASRGEIEFTGSAKHHAILPLIPRDEIKRQIKENYRTNRHHFGSVYKERGFFPPEMCYSKEMLGPIIETGHDWFVMSGVGCPVDWPYNLVHEIAHNNSRISVFFRDDVLSNAISFKQLMSGREFFDHVRQFYKEVGEVYVVTAMDAETFGHHIKEWEKLFLMDAYEVIRQEKLLPNQHLELIKFAKETKELEAVTISELLQKFPKNSVIEPKPSSWSTTVEDIEVGNYYPLWKDKDNRVHSLQWEATDLCIELVRKALEVADNEDSKRYANISRLMLDRALHSCQYWWASKRPMWDINMVFKGLQEYLIVILNAYRSIKLSGASGEVKKNYYYKVIVLRDIRNRIADELFTG